jgi:filamentous hemagglutinin
LQEGYNVELGLMFTSMLPSFDAQWGYSNYWMEPGETYPTLPSSERVMLHEGKQGKHIPGHNNYIPGKSILTHPDPQALLDSHAGTGTPVRGTYGQPGFVERVDFGQDIGLWVDQSTGVSAPTSIGRIHYSSNGAHIVPTRP